MLSALQWTLWMLYLGLQTILFPVIALYIIYRQRTSPLRGIHLKERLGLVPRISQKAQPSRIIWIHAVSVGEMNSIQAFVDRLKQTHPLTVVYLTTGTLAAKKIAQKTHKADYISMLPYDFLPCMMLAFWRINPSVLITVEAEWWPNLIFLNRLVNVPIYGLNSRLSARSVNRYKQFSWLTRQLFSCFSHLFVQTENDVTNFIHCGAKPEALTTLGNLKAYNVAIAHQQTLIKPQPHHRPTLLVGSLHEGEWSVYQELFKTVKASIPTLRMIIAPRHFTWQQRLEADLATLPYVSIIITPTTPETSATIIEKSDADIIAVCRLGELFSLYPYADLYFLGGTFVPVGGHSLLEPAVWGIPTIVGPHIFMTTHIAHQLEQAGGLFKANSTAAAFRLTQYLLINHAARKAAGHQAQDWLIHEAKKVGQHLEQLIQLL